MTTNNKTSKYSTYDPNLDQYSGKNLFPEKTKKAKLAISNPGIKEWLDSMAKSKENVG